MLVKGKHYRTVWMENNAVRMIDQRLLPFEFTLFSSKDHKETAKAIKDMVVRGAPAIGAAAGFGMAQGFIEKNEKNARKTIENSRPTARNLFYATERVFNAAINSKNKTSTAIKEAQKIADEDVENCKKIGSYGEKLIKSNSRVMTHCNAGWLACVDWGTALSPLYVAKRKGKKFTVYASETRPRAQGAKLTAWELKNENIDHMIIPDSASAYLMSEGKVDLIIVGADRIAANGDVANKIGTLEKAIAAKEFGVPFYVAAPTTTIDMKTKSGKEIPIEHRNEEEVLYAYGHDGKDIKKLLIANKSKAMNPAFDVTPARYITGIITEMGIVKPDKLKKLMGK